jgi:hypothetical protein
VIEAFGEFLIGGNFAVGLFVFMILMIINMVVITKGAGRVSEVSARFTLDAMPGKQMAIDADLAGGLITADDARARRREITTEADFYGSMDGASKFVKGDAIAALLILGVNIIAGFCLGMITHGLSASDAASRYISLSIGDALVAQVPALLLSIAAAVIVTRVTDSRDLAGQIGGQFADSAHGCRWRAFWVRLARYRPCPRWCSCPPRASPFSSGKSCASARPMAKSRPPHPRPPSSPTPPASRWRTYPITRWLRSNWAMGWCNWLTSGADRLWSAALRACASNCRKASALSCRNSGCAIP